MLRNVTSKLPKAIIEQRIVENVSKNTFFSIKKQLLNTSNHFNHQLHTHNKGSIVADC